MSVARIDAILGRRPAVAVLVAVGASLAGGTAACSPSLRSPVAADAPTPAFSASSAVLASPGEPSKAVTGFLDAADRRDHAAMAQLFGTWEGPAADTGGSFACALRKLGSWLRVSTGCPTPEDVELRMDLMARILAQAEYDVRGEAPVAGRERRAMQVVVAATPTGAGPNAGAASVVEVLFVVVQSSDGRWRVQEVALDRLTR